MEKWLCWSSLGVAGLLFLLFLLDLIIGIPFTGRLPEGSGSPFMIIDILGLLASATLGYLAFNAARDFKDR